MKKIVNRQECLFPGSTYHVYNRAISSDKLFITKKDYIYFLKKLERYILPIADIMSYCLIPNHFHLLLTIKDNDEIIAGTKKRPLEPIKFINQTFSNFFNSYSKSFNKVHNRMGRLFLYPYKRILVTDDEYLKHLVIYIHRNPIHHGLASKYSNWEYSSYNFIISEKETIVRRKETLALFGSKEEFILSHSTFQVV